jgi:hypothetical protein
MGSYTYRHMNTKTEVIGAAALAILVVVLVLWYMSEHPAPVVNHPYTATTISPGGTNAPGSLNETSTYYEIQASYPSSTSLKATAGAAADAKAVEIMKQFELNTIDAFKEQGNFANLTHDDVQMMRLDQRKETLSLSYQTKSGPKTISYLYTLTEDTLGAHPNTFFRTFTFNKKTGESLDISDLFTPGADYLSVLSAKSRALLPTTIAAREGVSVADVDTDYLNRGTTPDADNFQNWYLEGSNLVLVFPPYQVAPYAAGMQTASIPLSQLSSSLNASYR